jgi:phage/plasmid-like protein (TIGR03299 family)
MPAGLEQDEATGQVAAAFARKPGWHRLGTTLDRGLTADDILRVAHLGGWQVRVDAQPARNNNGIPIPGKYAINRTNPFNGNEEPLGVAGRVWRPFQNEETLPLLDELRGQTNGEFETAGSLDGGRRVFITCKLPDGMLIGGLDPVDRYLTVVNYHDGAGALILLDTAIRSVCANTVAAALANHRSKVSLWHTEGGRQSIMELRARLGITYAYDAELEKELERMIQAPCSEAEFVTESRKLWAPPNPDSKRAVNNQRRRELDLVTLFLESDTNKGIRSTRWGAYNAVTEYLDWATPVGEHRNPDMVRAARTVQPDGAVAKLKEHAFAAFRVHA